MHGPMYIKKKIYIYIYILKIEYVLTVSEKRVRRRVFGHIREKVTKSGA